MPNRAKYRELSTSVSNKNKNPCATAVAEYLGVADLVRYLHTYDDVKRAVAKKFSVRSVKTYVKSSTAGGARKKMSEIGAEYYIVWVAGHVLLMDKFGKTIVDTSPRKRDCRKILGIHGVYRKST